MYLYCLDALWMFILCFVCMFNYDDIIMMLCLKTTCFGVKFLKSLKLNWYMFIVFIIKPEVAGTMTQCLSTHDPIEKSNISHSYISVSSSECNVVPGTVLCLSYSTTVRRCYCYLNGPFSGSNSSCLWNLLSYLEITRK